MYVVDYTTGTYFTSHPVDFAGNGGTSASTTYTSNNLSTFFYSEFLAMAATEDANKNPGAPTPGTWTAQSATVGQTYINTSGAIKVGVVYYCVGNVTCNAGAGSPTLIGSSTIGTTYPVAWNSQPADGTYTVFAKGFDNASNATSSSSVVVTVDNTAPTFTSAVLSGASS